MHALASAFDPISRVVVATLFNSLWEGAILALAVWLILRAVPNLNATTRYAAWCVALVGSLVLPFVTALPQITVEQRVAVQSSASPAYHAHAAAAAPKTAVTKNQKAVSVSAQPAPAFRIPDRIRFALPEYVALGIFGLWLAAALLLLVRLGVNLWRLERLKKDALPMSLDYRESLAQWAAAEKGQREVRLCISSHIDVPVAVGLFDSMILIPQHLLETLTPDEIDQIMLHELGHLRRADDWTNGLQRLVQAMFFFNPAILFVAAQLDLEREVACDDWVLRQTKSVRPYATCLTKMAQVTVWPHRALAAPGVFVTRRGLSVRVERLLRAGRNVRTSVSFGPAGAVVAAFVVMFFLLQTVAPSFAFTMPDKTQAPLTTTQSARVVHSAHVTQSGVPVRTVIFKKSMQVAAVPAPTASPAPRDTDFTIPERHVHVPARTVHIPAINVDIPRMHIHIPPVTPHVHVTGLGPNFGQDIARQVSQAMSAAGVAANGYHGRFNCQGCDFSRQNLSGHSFRGQRLSGADFSRSNLSRADFSNSELVGVDFKHADLSGASFENAVMTGCDLTDTTLTGVNFNGVKMVGCDFNAQALSNAQARALLAACRTGCDFHNANLAGADLRGISVVGLDLHGADLRNADFSGANLEGVDFNHARLDGAKFNHATLTGCDFSGVDLNKVDFSTAVMQGDKLNIEH